MSRSKSRIAILGGGVAGLAAAWRLSEPGWQDRFESITVYQRGFRLGGKGASSRGEHGRIEEHGLHVWLGSYENAFALLRDCYAQLDRTTTDPESPIRTWDQALVPADNLGLADRWGSDWLVWPGRLSRTDGLPGDPDASGRELTVVDFLRRAMQLLLDFAESVDSATELGLVLTTSPDPPRASIEAVQTATLAAAAALATQAPADDVVALVDQVLDVVNDVLDGEQAPDQRRSWLLLSMVTATARGLIADGLVSDPRGFRALNDEDFCDWISRHRAHPDVAQFPLVRAMYDMVFGYTDGDPGRPAFGAGVAIFLTGVILFGYKGAFFWKMTAGMGDVVIAPLYQALRHRGVAFEFFHRVDELHLDADRRAVEAITMGRQVRLADSIESYEPLTRVRGLPVFPDRPLDEQIESGVTDSLETYFGPRHDVETRVLRRGVDFDHVVLAVSLGMIPFVAKELIEDRPDWREMTAHVRTVATQSFQIWWRPDDHALGWHHPGVTTSAYVPPFDTWASMPQTLWAEDWPDNDRPAAVGYFCGSLETTWPTTMDAAHYISDCHNRVRADVLRFLDDHIGLYLPHAVTEDGFAWHLVSGVNGARSAAALATQHVSVNIDPSDRYVQSVPGSDCYRLRCDESGYDNVVLAGDWTDCGMNAGCIEAAVMSGLQAANALLGRSRFHRIRGYYLP
ncbi:FAD-dependent oxidoreductase [Mycobacterium sp. 1274761.0]|uniref:FAD-dependent oxidoreductase n=1 Tax=Mycobacterium sp. 1274761.0 TaxID=1834077 RepID=UPI0007FD10F2|nr:FAD-dependent oxidoreductase [Mycobacterium sp. 1274761.0]OBK70474.1 amine oxidase [Mycobacterium sp. 1274761.0]